MEGANMQHQYWGLTGLWSVAFWVLVMLAVPVAQAQQTVEGVVTDAGNGTPIPGANVRVKNTTIGTTTSVEGAYQIELPANRNTLVFSFVGYRQKEVEVPEGETQIDVQLEEDVVGMDEVVVTGLASSVKRQNLANSVATVSAEELAGTTVNQTVDAALAGKIAGANIRSYSGAPGGGISIKLRGISTINGNSQPLYILDGVILDNSAIQSNVNAVTQAATGGNREGQDNPVNRIADLNPADIESIEVLKGASAAAIYGGRASNGVVIIRTKSGRAGQTRVNFSQSLGWTTILNPLGMRQFTREEAVASFGERGGQEWDAANGERGFIDYEEQIFGQEGLLSTTNLSLNGGNEQTKFFISGLLKADEGIVERTGYDKKSIRVNVDHQISQAVDVRVGANYVNSEARRGLTGNDNSGTTFGVALTATPNFIDLLPDESGIYPDHPFNTSNPLHTRDIFTNAETTNRFIGNAQVNFNLLTQESQTLRFVVEGGADYYTLEQEALFPRVLQFERQSPTPGTSILGETTSLNVNARGVLVHTYQLEGGTAFNTQLGVTGVEIEQNNANVVANNLITGQRNINQAGQLTPNQNRNIQRDRSFFAQEEVNWNDRVIVTAGLRGDRSSVNGDTDRFYIYPKASIAINVAEFDFWTFDPITQLKPRFAFGQTGNTAGPGVKFTSFLPTSISSNIGGIIERERGFPDIKPERQTEFEGGVDLSLYDGRASLELTVYRKEITDQLLQRQLPGSSGFSLETLNGGTLVNRGIEIGLTLVPVRSERVQWTSRTNFWTNDAEVTDLPVPPFRAAGGGFGATLGELRIEEGKSPTQIVGIDDRDGDGAPDGVFQLGDTAPDFEMSFSNSVRFLNGFDLSFLAHWKKGGDNLNLTKLLYDLSGTTPDFDDDDDGDGTANGPERLALLGVSAQQFVENSSYFRLREIGLYYSLPERFVGQLGFVRRVRIGASANNVFTITPYSSYDPEVNNFGTQPVATGVEVTPFPSSRTFMFHLDIGL